MGEIRGACMSLFIFSDVVFELNRHFFSEVPGGSITIRRMPDLYTQLLDATIQHLQNLKARGARSVCISPHVLQRLQQPAGRPGQKKIPPSAASTLSAPTPAQTTPAPQSRVMKGQLRHEPAAREILFAPEVESNQPVNQPPLDPAAKAAAFQQLRQRTMACVKCEHLVAARKNVVFGVGNIDAELMFVGEAPGADEDAQGEPFVGRAGQLLTKIIETMGLDRNSVYIANILKCRPDTPGQPTGNRKPTSEEMQTCIPFLHEQIDLIRPKVLVALGGTAVEGLLGKTTGIMRLRGHWQTYRNIPLMPTYHPAYLLRNQAPVEKRRVWEDMLQVMEKLQMNITEKQRGFFMKGT
jgi:DNA polymerase